jgi:hypothetical protein
MPVALQKPTSPIFALPPTTELTLLRASATLSGESADQFRTRHNSTKLQRKSGEGGEAGNKRKNDKILNSS